MKRMKYPERDSVTRRFQRRLFLFLAFLGKPDCVAHLARGIKRLGDAHAEIEQIRPAWSQRVAEFLWHPVEARVVKNAWITQPEAESLYSIRTSRWRIDP